MQLRDHIGSTKTAVVLHPSATVVSFAELDARANQLAHFLRRVGLGAGDTVALLMENNTHVHAALWAARRRGLYYTVINTHLTAPEAAYIVADSGAKAVISSHAMRSVCAQLPVAMLAAAVLADGDLDGWQRYPDCVTTEAATPIADESDG